MQRRPSSRKVSDLTIVIIVVLVSVLVIGGIAGFLWWKDNTTVCQGKLTITIHNDYFSDVQYDLYFDGELVDEDTIPAHYDRTVTWNMGWVAADPYKDISLVWASGSETKTVYLEEDSVSSVSFTVT